MPATRCAAPDTRRAHPRGGGGSRCRARGARVQSAGNGGSPDIAATAGAATSRTARRRHGANSRCSPAPMSPVPPRRSTPETRWLLYEVESIGHVSTSTRIVPGFNDVAAQLLGHFSPDALEAVGVMPRPSQGGAFQQVVTVRVVPAARRGRPAALDRGFGPATGRHAGHGRVVPHRRERTAAAEKAERAHCVAHGCVDARAVGRNRGVFDARRPRSARSRPRAEAIRR